MTHVELLRSVMRREHIDAFITPSTDPHSGEYIPERWKSRQWISGFNGSAGTAVVTMDQAALWTDSRYFIAAAEQLAGTEFVLMKEKIEGTPSIVEWLAGVLPKGATVAVDGWVNTICEVEKLRSELDEHRLRLRTDFDPYDEIWTDRPSLPMSKAFIQPLEYAGESVASKLERIRKAQDGHPLLVSMLEEVAWTLNLRASDVEYTPFVLAYLLITPKDATLFIHPDKLTPEVCEYLAANGVATRGYDEVFDAVSSMSFVCADPMKTNYAVTSKVPLCAHLKSPVANMLMFKNETEIRGYHSAMLKDGIAMVRWMKWTLEAVPKGGQTELSLSAKLEAFRQEQPLYKGPSFESIMAYAHHGAIVHYEPTPESDIAVRPEGLLLIDSGGQYLDGTTDITRTLPLGPLTDDMRLDYTLALRGFINLSRAVFPKGTCGTQLDALARAPMWQYGRQYLHGTGHGVGQFMSVHESIDMHQFRMQWRPTPLLPGMTITVEPGIYIEGSHGVRHENTTVVVEADFSHCGLPGNEGKVYGPYYRLEPLTLCPVITSPVLMDMLPDEEREWLNNYHKHVYETLAPHLDDEHREWLKEITKSISNHSNSF